MRVKRIKMIERQARTQGRGSNPLSPLGVPRGSLPPPPGKYIIKKETTFKKKHLTMTKTKGLSKFPTRMSELYGENHGNVCASKS